MPRPDWESWEAQEPPRGFAGRVVDEALARQGVVPPPSRRPGRRVLSALLLAASMAAAVALLLHVRRAHREGAVTASARQEVQVGGRALAVLEPGARVAWKGDEVRQDAGDVFWRVEAGARFVVHTPEGEVTVKGTCFRVRVLAGAGAAVAVAVLVYEGRVGVSRAGTEVELGAGQSAEADERGVHRTTVAAAEPTPARNDDAAHAVARLDRARADRMREQLHALFADAGALALASAPGAASSPAPAGSFPTMPVLGTWEGGAPRPDPDYIRQRVREDLFPLAKDCYADALGRDPKSAGSVILSFRILGDRKIGGVVDDAKVTDDSTLLDPEMQTCVRESMMAVSFDAPPEDGEITVVYPITFSPDDDDGGDP